jgi:predicted metalloendopeptidase
MAGNENPAPVSALANSIMSNIKQQFKQNLPEIVWLDEDALSATQIKLDALTEQYSYPQVWPNFSGLIMDPQDLLANVITARSNHFQRKIQQYGATVDRNSWEFLSNPQTVNAFYFSLKNQIHLLAGLLRAPFLDLDSPAVLNYAAVGMVAAHELMHGFNQHGRYFQADGHFQPLWSKKVNRNFSKLSQCVRNQYSRFPVAPGLKINGKTTLEENLADMGGLKLAYQAFQNVSGEPETFVVNNQTLTANQLFFIRYAQNYCSASREGVEKYLSSRSWWRYSPDRYRVIGPIINRPEFSQAFDCPRGAVMNPVKKCSVW